MALCTDVFDVILFEQRASNNLIARRNAASALEGPRRQSKSSDIDARLNVVSLNPDDEYLEL